MPGKKISAFRGRIKKVFKNFPLVVVVLASALSVASIITVSFLAFSYYKKEFFSQQNKDFEIEINEVCDILESNTDGISAASEKLKFPGRNIRGDRIRLLDENFIVVFDTQEADKGKTLVGRTEILAFKSEDTHLFLIEEKNSLQGAKRLSLSDGDAILVVNRDITAQITSLDNVSYKLLIISALLGSSAVIVMCIMYFVYTRRKRRIERAISDIVHEQVADRLPVEKYPEYSKIFAYINAMLDDLTSTNELLRDFVSNASHELKTPMTSMKLLADSLLSMEDVPQEMYREFLTDIVGEIDRENSIIEDLLNLTHLDNREDALNISSVDIDSLIESVLKNIKPIAQKKNIEIVYEKMADVTAEVDAVKFSQVITNLVENAVKYNNENGKVIVSLNADYEFFYFKVEDNGVGIPEEHQKNIFKRFYRVDKARSRETGGTGLGLSIVEAIVLKHNGRIRVHSGSASDKDGSNITVFSVRIPLKFRR